jgi:DNA-binding MarR family transcriptional regulator
MAEQSLIFLIRSLKNSCLAQENSIRDNLGLSVGEYHCLSVLSSGVKLSSSAVSRIIGRSPSRTTRLIDKLIKRGYVQRAAGPDRRTDAIALSPSGCKVHQQIEAGFRECEEKLRRILGRQEYQAAQRTLQRVIDATAAVKGA